MSALQWICDGERVPIAFFHYLFIAEIFTHLYSGFPQWQSTREIVTPEQFSKLFPDIYEDWELEESPPQTIFVYEHDFWILEVEPKIFLVKIERDEWHDTCLEIAEMRLFVWAYYEIKPQTC